MVQDSSPGDGMLHGAAPLVQLFSVDSLKDKPARVTFSADSAACTALAALNNLVMIRDLGAQFEVARSGRNGARVTGEVIAHVVQRCVVTLEPFDAEVREPVEARYMSQTPDMPASGRGKRSDILRQAHETVIEHHMDDEDAPELIINGKIDLGALATEFFTLGLYPYPRKPGADLTEVASGIANLEIEAPAEPETTVSPFSKLAGLKNNTKSDG